MPINYGSGELGNATISSNQTVNAVREYENLTIDSGTTVTIPSGGVLQVADTLTLNGTITVDYRIGSSGNGGVPGGDAGGAGVIMARNITGSGAIRADGENGSNGSNATSNNANANSGLPPTIPGKSDNLITTGSNGGGRANNSNGGGGSNSSVTVMDRDMVNIWLDQWAIPAAHVSSFPAAKILTGGGGGGGYGGNGSNGNNRYSGGGGGGGAGGSSAGRGGNGGSGGNASNSNNVSQNSGQSGGGGGGAGGVLILITDSVPSNINTNAIGGAGGSGANANANNDGPGGGGGGGGGGIVIAITPGDVPSYNVSGGSVGSSGNGGYGNANSGNAGTDGIFKHIPAEVIQ
ncbi:hypothetical protein [Halorubrum sp. F4]|uniref:hypothetical protein n=1 Tax=Halorubrum sp. F4 TaxID=2989715 RepID=UPI0024804343|nr:hypothetical protein [Halorubrum sp. F4]